MPEPMPQVEKREADESNVMPVSFLTEAEMAERSFDINKVYMISQVRETPHPQFDEMSYLQWNETNEKADMSFLPRKRNKQDSRITSGITHEKDSTLLSMLTGFNFEGKVQCFYKNQELYDVGTALTAWVRKSREDERYDEKRRINYRNLLVQGTAFVREKFVEMEIPNKILVTENIDFTKLDEVLWNNAGNKKITEGAVSYLVDGKKVFLENIREQDIRLQPGVYVVEYVPRELIRAIFGKSSRWKYVPKQCNGGTEIGQLTRGTIYSDWTFAEVDATKIEVIESFRPFENRYQIYLNGVPMLPAGFPLTAISPTGFAPLAKGDIDPMNLFAYSKGIPAKTKIDQAVYDMMLKVILIKAQQAAFVPSVNNTGKVLSSRIFMPANISQGFNAEKLQALIKEPGIQNNDFALLKFLSEQMDNKSVNSVLEGQGSNAQTLGEYQDKTRKSMIKIGGIFDGVINWEKQLLQLRVANLLANGARKHERSLSYKDISFGDNFEDDGSQGMRILRFNENNVKTSDEVFDEEIKLEQEQGVNARINYMDPKLLKQMLVDPDYSFRFEVVPVDKNNDNLTKSMFLAMITQTSNLFGMESMAVQRLKRRYAQVMGEEYDNLFLSDEQQQAKQLEMQQQAMMAGAQPAPGGGAPQGDYKPVAGAGGGRQLAIDRVFQ